MTYTGFKCYRCKKPGLVRVTRVFVSDKRGDKFRDFCEECYQKTRQERMKPENRPYVGSRGAG